MSLLAPPIRRHDDELLDDPAAADPRELERSLAHVEAVDRWLGGERALRRHLRDLPPGRGVHVLDVGTGDGQVLRRTCAWLDRRNGLARGVGVDLHGPMLTVASRRSLGDSGPPVRLVRADGLALPFADDSFDVSTCTLTLHHFGPDDAVSLVREMARVTRGRVLVGDLERSRLNYLGARLLAATVWRRNPITRHDGPLSVLRSFTPEELDTVGRKAGLRNVRVRRHLPFRLVLEGRS